jgi:hypothetical protein
MATNWQETVEQLRTLMSLKSDLLAVDSYDVLLKRLLFI